MDFYNISNIIRPDKIRLAEYKPVTGLKKPYSLEQDKLIKGKIYELEKSIGRKRRALKLGKAEEDETLDKLFKPIIIPLKELKGSIPTKHNNQNISLKYIKSKDREEKEDEEYWEDAVGETYAKEMIQKPVPDEYFDQFPPLARHYIEGYLSNHKEYDQTYGVRFDLQANKLYMGNKEMKINRNSQIIMDDEIFEGSEGLYSLLFMKHPNNFSGSDLADYKNILQLTSAHKRNYDSLEQFAGTKAFKYTKIIKPLFEDEIKIHDEMQPSTTAAVATTKGSGMNRAYNNKRYKYNNRIYYLER